MLRRKRVGHFDGLLQGIEHHNRAVGFDGRPRDRGGGQRRELRVDFFGDGLRQTARCREQNRRRVHIVLGLRQQIGGDPARVAVGRDDDDLGWAGDKVDPGFARDQLLRGGDIYIAWAHNAIDLRHRLGSIRQCGDGLRATHAEHVRTPSHCAMPIISGLGFGHATQMVATPATCAGITVISSVEGRG